MQISARNMLKGKISKIESGAVNSEITITLSGGADIVSVITKHSVERLNLKQGDMVYALIKSSDVMVVKD